MGSPILDAQAAKEMSGVAADSRSLDRLHQLANRDPAKAVKQVATQFEALFMQMVIKSMREATMKSGLLDSSDQQLYTGMLDEQFAQKIASGSTGLADVIARQLSRNLPASALAAGASEPPATAAAAPDVGAVSAGREPTSGVLQAIRAASVVHTRK